MKRRSATSWVELRALDGFRDSVDRIDLQQAKLVGEYEMPGASPMQPCGITQCKTPHRKGFIVELPDESISHVGGYCGKKHFGGESWKLRLKTYRQAAKAQSEAAAFLELKARAEAILQSPPPAPLNLPAVRKMLASFDALPPEVRNSLISRAQDRKSKIVRFRAPTDKEIRDAKFHGGQARSQIPETVGTIDGLAAILTSRRADHIFDSVLPSRLEAIRRNLDQDTNGLFESLRGFNAALALLENSIADASLFFKQDNLNQILLLPAASRLNISAINVRAGPDFEIILTVE